MDALTASVFFRGTNSRTRRPMNRVVPLVERRSAERLDERLGRIEASISLLKSVGVAHAIVEGMRLDGRSVELNGRRVVNFGNCSYLGLESEERLKLAACEAVERYGTVFSSSRAYLSVPLYTELEALLSELVG